MGGKQPGRDTGKAAQPWTTIEPPWRSALLEAMLFELAERGYGEFSLETPLVMSGVTQAELEEEFGDEEGALLAAYGYLRDEVSGHLQRVCAGEAEWTTRVRLGLAVLLEEIAARPAISTVATRVLPGIGPRAYQLYGDFLAEFEPALSGGRDYASTSEELPAAVELFAVGAAESIIFGEVDAGRAEALPRMLPEILFSVLVPFMGPERATLEMRGAAAEQR